MNCVSGADSSGGGGGRCGGGSGRLGRDEQGRSALHLAASAGRAASVRQLLGAVSQRELDAPDAAGCTPLQRAAADGHEHVLQLLLQRGAAVDKQDTVVSTPPPWWNLFNLSPSHVTHSLLRIPYIHFCPLRPLLQVISPSNL